jgi:translation initiation factor 3 subunit D
MPGAHFDAPLVVDNKDGWGPTDDTFQYKDMPYQPYSKNDQLGKIADWSGTAYGDKRNYNRYRSQFGAGVGMYQYIHEDDENTFQLVDSTRLPKPPYQKRTRFQQNRFRQYQNQNGRFGPMQKQFVGTQKKSKTMKNLEMDQMRQMRKWQKQYGNRADPRQHQQAKQREPSVRVREDWQVIEEIPFSSLAKLSLPTVSEPQELSVWGSLEYYDKRYDHISTKREKKLTMVNRLIHKITTTKDPVIRQICKTHGNVFATDAIISTLMCCTRSVYPWDIVVDKLGTRLFFDKREDSTIDILTVNETANEPPPDDGTMDSAKNLGMEAVFINHNFAQQVLKMNEERYKFPNPNPFIQSDEESEAASVAYRYRSWDLGNNQVIVIRCEQDCVQTGPNGEDQFVNIKALNEWNPKIGSGLDWRTKLDMQRGAVLAAELRNNGFKLAKWTTCAILAGSDHIKFGYVSRQNFKDAARHTILGIQNFKPQEFATQMALNMDNGWGIVRVLVDFFTNKSDGRYLITKDPMKPTLRIYSVPENSFDSEEDASDDENDQQQQQPDPQQK